VTVNSSGTISPSALNIAVGDTVRFTYTNPGDEIVLAFSPSPPASMKLDHDVVVGTRVFSQAGTYTYSNQQGGNVATITVH
jgi:plastocyanin